MSARFRLAASVAMWRSGWAWPLAALLGAATFGLWVLDVQPRQEELRALQALPDRPAPSVTQAQANGQDPYRVAWRQLAASLPPQDAAHHAVASVLAKARIQSLLVDKAETQYRRDPRMRWVQMTLTVPLRGRYPAVRNFVEAMMREHPNLALDQVSFKRDSASDGEAEALVRFSAWYSESQGGRQGSDTSASPELTAGAAAPNVRMALDPRISLYPVRELRQPTRDPFAVQTWAPPLPRPAPLKAVLAEPVQAPSLPYVYAGKKLSDGKAEVFLIRGEFAFIVQEGDTLEGAYRAERITASQLTLVHLPTGTPQTLRIADAE